MESTSKCQRFLIAYARSPLQDCPALHLARGRRLGGDQSIRHAYIPAGSANPFRIAVPSASRQGSTTGAQCVRLKFLRRAVMALAFEIQRRSKNQVRNSDPQTPRQASSDAGRQNRHWVHLRQGTSLAFLFGRYWHASSICLWSACRAMSGCCPCPARWGRVR